MSAWGQVEDNVDDVESTLDVLRKKNIKNEVFVVNDRAEAPDFLFGAGKYSGRDLADMSTVGLSDIKLPRIEGLEVLQQNPYQRTDEASARGDPYVIGTGGGHCEWKMRIWIIL